MRLIIRPPITPPFSARIQSIRRPDRRESSSYPWVSPRGTSPVGYPPDSGGRPFRREPLPPGFRTYPTRMAIRPLEIRQLATGCPPRRIILPNGGPAVSGRYAFRRISRPANTRLLSAEYRIYRIPRPMGNLPIEVGIQSVRYAFR